jgi:hypothetical protein
VEGRWRGGGVSDVCLSWSSVMAPSEVQFVPALSRRKFEIHAFWFMTSFVQCLGRYSELEGGKVSLLCLMSQTIRIFVSTALITSNLALRKRIQLITKISCSCHQTFAMYDENLVPVELYYISLSYFIIVELPESIWHFCWPVNIFIQVPLTAINRGVYRILGVAFGKWTVWMKLE